MAYSTIALRISDSETDTRLATVPFRVPTGKTIAEVQTMVNNFAPLLDALTAGVIEEIEITIPLSVPVALKDTPSEVTYNERGALISFDTTGPYSDSIRIPAIRSTKLPGSELNLADADVTAFAEAYTIGVSDGTLTVRPKTAQDYEYVSAQSGKRSFRRK